MFEKPTSGRSRTARSGNLVKTSRLSRNFLFLAGSNFSVQFLRFLSIAVVARRIGSEFFGAYNYLLLLVTYGAVVVEFGLRNVAIREFAQGRGSRELVLKIVQIRSVLAGLAAILVVGLTHRAFPDGQFFLPSLIFGVSLITNAFLVDFLTVVEEKFFAQAAATVGQAAFIFLGVLGFVHEPSDFVWLAFLFLGGQLLSVAVYFFTSRVWEISKVSNSAVKLRATAIHGLPFLVALLFFTIQASADLLLLGQFRQSEILGDYSAALKIISIPQGLIAAFVVAMQPRIARETVDFGSAKLEALFFQTLRVLWIVLAPTVIGCWLFGDTLVAWVFGSKFPIASHFLKPLSLSFLFSCLSLAPIQALTTSSKTKLLLKLVLGNAVFTLFCISLALFWGRTDLVPWAMVGAQVVLTLSSWSCFPKKTYLVLEDARNLAFPTILMAAPLLLGPSYLPAPLVFALSAGGYLAGLIVVRIWRRPWVAELFGDLRKAT